MKKIHMAFFLCCLCTAEILSSCSSVKNVATADKTASGKYDSEGIQLPSTDSKKRQTGESGQLPKIVPKKESNWIVLLVVGDQQDIDTASTKIFQLTVLDALKQEDATVIYNIKSGKTGFSAMYQTAWYHLLFENDTRAAFSSASVQYLSDFEQKKLDRKNGKSYRIYGEYPVTLQWGTIPRMTSGTADTNVQFGYEFKKNSPYFSITVWSVANQKYTEGSSAVRQSPALHFYMTKVQVAQMADQLSDAKITEALTPYMKSDGEVKDQQKDKY